MTNYDTINTRIYMIRSGDTVFHNGELRTVCDSDIKRGGVMGTSLFGDSYRSGSLPVQLVQFRRAVL